MSVIEMLLRLGCSLVAWMILLTHFIWLATLSGVGCDGGDDLYRLLLGFAPLTIGFAFLLGLSKKLTSVHTMIRWGALPIACLLPLALIPIWQAFIGSTLNGGGLCQPAVDVAWHRWWAPIQLITLAIVAWRAYSAWRSD